MKPAIVLSAFGSAEVEALPPFLDIIKEVSAAFPACELRLALTSSTIRNIWNRRAEEKNFQDNHPEIPKLFYTIQSPLPVLADLWEKGCRKIIVQPLYMAEGAEFYDLRATVDALRSITTFRIKNIPFPNLALGRPFLGMNSELRNYHQDLEIMANALRDDIMRTTRDRQALVYAGHGNPHYATPAYCELETIMRTMTDIPVFFATLEGHSNLSSLLLRLRAKKIKKILLRPFLFTSGKHANKDITGKKQGSWEKILLEHGLDVQTELSPIGSIPQVRRILVQHIFDAATDARIDLL